MSVQDYVNSPKGQRRIRVIAKEMNNSHRIDMNHCMELARKETESWFESFNPAMEPLI